MKHEYKFISFINLFWVDNRTHLLPVDIYFYPA